MCALFAIMVFAGKKQRVGKAYPENRYCDQSCRYSYFAGAGACGVGGAAGAAGTVCVWAGGTLSITELFFAVVRARPSEVNMKMMAAAVVSFARKLWAPRGPKTV